MEIRYIPGAGPDFVVFIHSQGDKAQLRSIDGHARWVIIEEDGTEYIARPQEANPNQNG